MAETRTDVLVALPRPLTSLIGRDDELAHLYDLLTSEAALVTITGFGGIGKTRLALQAALELEPHFEAGVIFAQLASVTRGSSIAIAVALTAGLDESVETIPALAEALGPSTRLLVLDNLEQIPDAAEIVLEFMRAMPQVTILATTRNRLELGGEYVLPLEPLETQSTNARSLPAVQLFIERGKAAAPSLPTDDDAIAVIAEICQKLDGIPLAIELAAARLAIFSLKDLRDQLQNILPILASTRVDMPDRQRTMRNAIAWTYELLEDSERRLFTWLSVYEQDFSLDSIKHVAHQLELTDDPLDLVQFLVSRSLIRPGRREAESPRYQMLQMLREFGHEHLKVMNEDHLARRSHAMDMVNLAEMAEPLLTTAEVSQISRRLTDDLPNLFTAIQWSKANNSPEIGQRIFASIWRYIENSGHISRFLEFTPDTGDGSAEDAARARALVGIGYLHEKHRNLAPALQTFTQAVEIASNLPDQTTHVVALTGLATVQFDYSDVPLSQELFAKASDLSDRIGYQRGQMTATGMLAIIDLQLGNFEQAIATNHQLQALAYEMGDLVSVATFHMNNGVCYQSMRRFEEAQESFLTALEIAERVGDLAGAAICYANLSGNSVYLNKLDEASEYGQKGLELSREIGQRNSESTLLMNLSGIKHRQEDYGASVALIAQASKLMDFDGGIKEQAHFASVMCETCLIMNLNENAAEMLGATLSMRKSMQLRNEENRLTAEEEALKTLDPDNNPNYAEAMARGAELDRTELAYRIQELSRKIIFIQPPKSEVAAPPPKQPAYALTPRETEVLAMVAKGFTNGEIAEEMYVSTRTITTHLTNIFTKLDVSNRSRAIAVATEAGLV